MAPSKKTSGPKMFGDSDTDRRLAGVGDRRVTTSDYRYAEYPKAVYHDNGSSRVVKDEAELAALGSGWGADTPDVHGAADTHTAAVLKGDGVPVNQDVQKVQVVNPEAPTAAVLSGGPVSAEKAKK